MIDYPQTTEFIQLLSKELGTDPNNSFPWLPLPTENPADYMAFELWRDMGSKRPNLVSLVSQQNHWASRALAFDTWMQSQPTTLQEQAEKIAKNIMKGSNMLLDGLQVELIKNLRNLGSTTTPGMTLPELVKAFESLAKTSRLLADKSTDNVDVRLGHAPRDLSVLSDEELEMAESLNRKTLTVGST